ncbi:hypothetical protein L1286_06565 [Pseudoalteromonas sp. SMS1]|uniref:hypothetical protein n=1 Tax=Pseudoalteromonas sp. SMS1 TaxID=2908894 RepID=UPI001F1D3974|nr:hypothetical protein [Pseudoalteromonas sp. SMS1]MCF2857124.1 hypothetical protein [Pseudoalteromonas sp. SMS1]
MLTSDDMELIGDRALGFKNSITNTKQRKALNASLHHSSQNNDEIALFMEIVIRVCKKYVCKTSPIRSALMLQLQRQRKSLMQTFKGVQEGTVSPSKLDTFLQAHTESITAVLLPDSLATASDLKQLVRTVLFQIARESV